MFILHPPNGVFHASGIANAAQHLPMAAMCPPILLRHWLARPIGCACGVANAAQHLPVASMCARMRAPASDARHLRQATGLLALRACDGTNAA
ncbi:MAG: hypothetical protein IJT83_06550 [Victivallales bacterium]|nr:hypothetical protein [Victivallales bacterium]